MSSPEYHATYRAEHRERLRLAQQQWRTDHPEYQDEYRRSHLEEVAALRRANPNTPARNAAAQARRKQRSLGRSVENVHWTVFQRIAWLPCFDCGEEPARGTDHVIPFSFAGRNVIENLQPACETCNKRKGGGERARVS